MMKIRNISQFQSMEINFKSKQKRMKLNQSYQARFQRRFIGYRILSQSVVFNVPTIRHQFENFSKQMSKRILVPN